jgi:hypothetical protein
MSPGDRTLLVEITLEPPNYRRAGPGRTLATAVPPDRPHISRLTRLMALAIRFQDMVDRREVRDYADLARLGYVTRARLTHIMNLLLLAPDIQEEILELRSQCSVDWSEREIRTVTRHPEWAAQRLAWVRTKAP